MSGDERFVSERRDGDYCEEGQFSCSKSVCVLEEAQCNGQYNCGLHDDSDEDSCPRVPDQHNFRLNHGNHNPP